MWTLACEDTMTFDELLSSNRRRCYYLNQTEPDPSGSGRFLVSLVFEGESGHYPMTGRGQGATPWFWDQITCDEQNRKQFGVDPETAFKIVGSSMFAPKDTAQRSRRRH